MIRVDDLFFNLPARRKFLKTASAELRRILQVVNDYALIRPELTFRVFSDGKKILEILPSGNTDMALRRHWGEDSQIYSSGTALMLTIFALQDSFGTACNVTGDGALTLMLTGYAKRHHIEEQQLDVEL